MDPMLLHPVVTNTAIECLRVIASIPAISENESLIRQLAECGSRCVECAQGCQSGTCLPETVNSCQTACVAAEQVLEEAQPRLKVKPATLQTIHDCGEACREL